MSGRIDRTSEAIEKETSESSNTPKLVLRRLDQKSRTSRNVLPVEDAESLLQRGHMFYAWPSLPNAYRLVTSFTTTTTEIDEFIDDLKRC